MFRVRVVKILNLGQGKHISSRYRLKPYFQILKFFRTIFTISCGDTNFYFSNTNPSPSVLCHVNYGEVNFSEYSDISKS